MRRILLTLAAVAAMLAAANPARAGFIVGTQAFSSTATTSSPNVTNVNDTLFTFSFVTLLGGANQTGDYIGTFGSFVNSLDTTSPLSFVFGSALYGTFTADAVVVNSLIPNTSRTVQLSGTFSPAATTFGPGYDPTPGILTITINEASIGGRSTLSASATLATAAEVPEPSTIVLLASVCGPIGLRLVRRRRETVSA